MPGGATLPVLDHELADDELQWMKSVYAEFSKARRGRTRIQSQGSSARHSGPR
jgi:hypothetical protein